MFFGFELKGRKRKRDIPYWSMVIWTSGVIIVKPWTDWMDYVKILWNEGTIRYRVPWFMVEMTSLSA